jgi:hypothetical protein
VVETPLLPPPSSAATANDAVIGAIGLIPMPPPSRTTAIATANDHHHRFHSVGNYNHQKPAIVVHCQWLQLWSLSEEAVVDGSHGNGDFC